MAYTPVEVTKVSKLKTSIIFRLQANIELTQGSHNICVQSRYQTGLQGNLAKESLRFPIYPSVPFQIQNCRCLVTFHHLLVNNIAYFNDP